MLLSIEGQVIIFDEAHNMEDSSREAASLSFASLQLLEIVEEIENISEPWTSLYPSTAKSGSIDPPQRK